MASHLKDRSCFLGPDGFKDWALAGLVAALGAVLYANSLRSSFQFDDDIFIVHNTAVRNVFDWPVIWRYFNTRFLTGLSFAVNYGTGGLNVVGYHIVNVLLHSLNAVLVYGLVRLLGQTPFFRAGPDAGAAVSGRPVALFAALIFLTHPVQSQAVNYISQRAALLVAFFYLTAVVLYLGWFLSGRKSVYAAALGAAGLAMLSKESAFTLPVVLGITDLFFLKKPGEPWAAVGRRIGPFFLSWLIIPLALLTQSGSAVVGLKEQVLSAHPDIFNVMTAINVLRTYLRLCVVPLEQNLDYDFPRVQHLWHSGTLLSLGVLTAVAVFGVGQFRRRRMLTFAVVWFFLAMMMETASSAWLGRDMIFEHWLYLALAGFALFAASLAGAVCTRRPVFYAIIIVVIAWYSGVTFQRNLVWRDPVSLWTDVLRKSPNKGRAYDNLAAAYLSRGNDTAAFRLLQQALKINPANCKSLNNLGLIYMDRGEWQKAQAAFEQSLAVNPECAECWSNLGALYLSVGKFNEAKSVFQRVLAMSPHLPEAQSNLALVYAELGETQQAIEEWRRLIAHDPGDEQSWYLLAQLYLKENMVGPAENLAGRAVEKGTDAQRLTDLGSRFAARNRGTTALALFQRALTVDPFYPEAYLELGKFIGNRDDFRTAITVWQTGRGLFPDDARFPELIQEAERLLRGPSTGVPGR